MNWSAQSEEMLKNWTEVQTKMWDAWLAGVREVGRPATSQGWQRVIEQVSEAWFESVGRALDAQVEWTRIWAKSLAEGNDAQAVTWAQQFADAMKRWVEMQKQLWERWFDMFKKLGPDQSVGAWDSLWKTWETAARQGLDAQAAWTKAWTPKSPSRTGSGA